MSALCKHFNCRRPISTQTISRNGLPWHQSLFVIVRVFFPQKCFVAVMKLSPKTESLLVVIRRISGFNVQRAPSFNYLISCLNIASSKSLNSLTFCVHLNDIFSHSKCLWARFFSHSNQTLIKNSCSNCTITHTHTSTKSGRWFLASAGKSFCVTNSLCLRFVHFEHCKGIAFVCIFFVWTVFYPLYPVQWRHIADWNVRKTRSTVFILLF